MWYAQILNSLEVDVFSEEQLQDITNHLQSISVSDSCNNDTKQFFIESANMGYEFTINNQLSNTQIIIKYLQLWNQELHIFSKFMGLIEFRNSLSNQDQSRDTSQLSSASFTLTNQSFIVETQLFKQNDKSFKYSTNIMQLMMNRTVSQIYESTQTLYHLRSLDNQNKQYALQAIQKLQQLTIKSLEPKLNRKVNLLMAKLQERMALL
ncbi:unnamed protein product (macronuclear) [Paramecium tetraurelia]|uniref:Uncharacterized protein n=1 Tax=Paramecium tetraurelia TaxID=5888 RepID=A0BHL4_PARTE|nr:uncharacterized protein GSPATT00029066001 [Paramecium tetraurelia]CAK58031.1 unnamed protein product [Paramecium tetraurelia]|eukprot:XP_001425429.1 hypothetical protein (macronuclear) [Paramecium tetraurelia strain d4-2]